MISDSVTQAKDPVTLCRRASRLVFTPIMSYPPNRFAIVNAVATAKKFADLPSQVQSLLRTAEDQWVKGVPISEDDMHRMVDYYLQ